MFKIEKGIEIPKCSRGRKAKYPLSEMEVGDSFLVPDNSAYKSISTCAVRIAKNHSRKFTVRTVEEGVRVWRIA